MSKRELSLLVTRPLGQASAWLEAFQSEGWQALHFPTLAIIPTNLSPKNKSLVLALDQYKGVICISANAAHIGLELLSDYWPQWPVQQNWYAVGPATAEAMVDWQIRPKMPTQHDSEGLLGLGSLKAVSGERILILKGEGGRETLKQVLSERGAKVDELALYRRAIPETDIEPLVQWLGQDSDYVKVITVTSGDALKHLLHMAEPFKAQLLGLPLLVVSERLKTYALSLGFQQVLLSQGTSVDAVKKTLTDFV